MKVALLGRKIEGDNLAKLEILLSSLARYGAELCYFAPFHKHLCGKDGFIFPSGSTFSSESDLPGDTGLFLTLGGDGTFLASLSFVKNRGIPVAGINFGRLGFLTTASVDCSEPEWVDDLLSLKFDIEERSVLKVSGLEEETEFYPYAFNEISFQRTGPVMITVNIKINGKVLPPYRADGLVIATPAGSTAYSLSVGGPIVLPESEVLVISPVAPHNLNVRPLVVPTDSVIEAEIYGGATGALLTADNRSMPLANGTVLTVTSAEYKFKYVSLYDTNFIKALKDKLMWGEDKRNI